MTDENNTKAKATFHYPRHEEVTELLRKPRYKQNELAQTQGTVPVYTAEKKYYATNGIPVFMRVSGQPDSRYRKIGFLAVFV